MLLYLFKNLVFVVVIMYVFLFILIYIVVICIFTFYFNNFFWDSFLWVIIRNGDNR